MEKLLSPVFMMSKNRLNLFRYVRARCLNRPTNLKCLLRNENTNNAVVNRENGHRYVLGYSGHLDSDNQRMFIISNMTQHAQRKHLKKELRAFSNLLERSGYGSINSLLYNQQRCFSTSKVYFNKDDNDSNREKDKEDREEEDREKTGEYFRRLFWRLFVLSFILAFFIKDFEVRTSSEISWQTFQHDMLARGEVREIAVLSKTARIKLHDGAMINHSRSPFGIYYLEHGDQNKFEEKLRRMERELGISAKDAVPIAVVDEQQAFFWYSLLMLGFLITVGFMTFRGVGTDVFSHVTKAKFTRVDRASKRAGKGITFKDVAGLKEAKVEIMEFVDYLKYPHRFKALGGKIPKGALLLGPPGCGKTLLAKAVAAEAKVPFLAMAGSEFVEMIGGLGASRVRDLFKEARKNAPCIIYVDEIDALGRKRSGSGGGDFGSSEEEHTLNQLLVELDGMGTVEGVIMLASTNRADVLDKALLRPGRFDRHITIDLPTVAERLETFEMYLAKLKLEGSISQYAPRLAQMTPGMSGADIANVCNEAALYAARNSQDVVGAEDFNYAVERVVAGIAKKSGQLSPVEKKVVAYHESGHAIVGWMLKHTDALLRISIVPRTNNALGFAQYVPSDQKLYSTEELFERMCMALGGRAAESIIFNHITTGAADDLKRVTKLAYKQIRSYGMNERVGHLSFPDDEDGFGTKPYSKRLGALMDEEARVLVGRAYKHAEKILQENKDKLSKLAEALLQKEVMTYEEVTELIGAPPHGQKNIIDPTWVPSFNNNDNNNRPKTKQTEK